MVRCVSMSLKPAKLAYSILALKSILGLNLLAYAYGRKSQFGVREEQDRVNHFGRKPIGDSAEEQVNFDQPTYLSRSELQSVLMWLLLYKGLP